MSTKIQAIIAAALVAIAAIVTIALSGGPDCDAWQRRELAAYADATAGRITHQQFGELLRQIPEGC